MVQQIYATRDETRRQFRDRLTILRENFRHTAGQHGLSEMGDVCERRTAEEVGENPHD